MVSADDPRVRKMLSFSVTREDLAILVVTGTDEQERLRDQLGSFAQAMREGGWDRLATRVEQILRDEHGSTDCNPDSSTEPKEER
jgi:hypothetical protein